MFQFFKNIHSYEYVSSSWKRFFVSLFAVFTENILVIALFFIVSIAVLIMIF